MIEIEKATIDDLTDLLAWRREVLGAVFDLRDGLSADALMGANLRYYEQAFANGSHLALFARVQGERVGCGALCLHQEMPSPDNPSGKCAYLMNIYTRPEARGRGVAACIVRELVDWARGRGYGKIYLETTREGRSVYEAAGFADLPDIMIYQD